MANIHLNWLIWLHFLILEEVLLVILVDCMIFLSPFLDFTRMSISTVYFLAQLDWNSLPIECFPLTYDLKVYCKWINFCKEKFLKALVFPHFVGIDFANQTYLRKLKDYEFSKSFPKCSNYN